MRNQTIFIGTTLDQPTFQQQAPELIASFTTDATVQKVLCQNHWNGQHTVIVYQRDPQSLTIRHLATAPGSQFAILAPNQASID